MGVTTVAHPRTPSKASAPSPAPAEILFNSSADASY